jgi:cobalt/nickel transport protein
MKLRDILIGLAAAFLVAAIISPFASSAPDGLEWVAERIGFAEYATDVAIVESPLPDYQLPSIESEGMSTAIAGIVGTAMVLMTLYGVGRILRRRSADG